MIDLMKQLLNIDLNNTSKDITLNFHLDNAETAIKNYLNIDMTVEKEIEYKNQIVKLAIYYYNNFRKTGLKSSTEGRVSQAYEDNFIPNDIKGMLSSPYIRVMG